MLIRKNSYHLWGVGAEFRGIAIAIGPDERYLRADFDQVEKAGVYTCKYCINWRNNIPIFIARGPRFSLREAWPKMKHYE